MSENTTGCRQDALKAWLAEKGLSLSEIGRRIGVTAEGARWILKSNTVHPYRYIQLVELGIPKELLPEPAVSKFGPRALRCAGCDEAEIVE